MERRAGGEHPYRGEDRRLRTEGSPRVTYARAVVVLAGLAAVALLFGVAPTRGDGGPVSGDDLTPVLDAAAMVTATLIGVLCVLRWRIVGHAWSLWVGTAALTYGVATLGFGHVLPAVLTDHRAPQVLAWMGPASRLVVLGLLLEGVRSPSVDAGLTPRRTFGRAAAATAILTVLFQLLPGLGTALAGGSDSLASARAFPLGSVLLIACLSALGFAYVRRSVQLPRPPFSWFGVMLVGLALAETLRLVAVEPPSVWASGGGVLRLGALLVAATGTTRDLLEVFGEQSGRLLESVASGATAEARIRAEQAALEERAHEARNALAAIEGATRTLEHHHDRLDPATRASLAEAVSVEIARLQRLVSAERVDSALEDFPVGRALRAVVTAAGAGGMAIEVDIPEDLLARGRPQETAEVVQNLLENARRYGRPPVTVRAAREDDRVVIAVEDRGPGVPEPERAAIFSRGVRGEHAGGTAGDGLGLYVCRNLMREQGGDIRVEGRRGGGASFVLRLPAPRSADLHPDAAAGAHPRHGHAS